MIFRGSLKDPRKNEGSERTWKPRDHCKTLLKILKHLVEIQGKHSQYYLDFQQGIENEFGIDRAANQVYLKICMAMAGRNFLNSLGDPYAPSIDEVQALYDTTPTESNGDNRILSATLGESPYVYTRGPSNNFVLDEFLDENIPTDDMAPTTTIPLGVSASTASDGVGHEKTPLGDIAPPTASDGAPNRNIPPDTSPTASDGVGHGNTLPGDSSPTKCQRKLSALEWYTWGQCFASAKSAKAFGLKVDRYTALTCFQKAFEKSKGTGSDFQHMAYKKWNEVAKRLAKYLKKRLPKSRNEITNQGDKLVKEIEARREDVEKILAAEANGQRLTPFPLRHQRMPLVVT